VRQRLLKGRGPNDTKTDTKTGRRSLLMPRRAKAPTTPVTVGFDFIYACDCAKRMKTRFRLIRRGVRGCRYYCVDTLTGKRTSLKTRSEDDALQIVQAKNQALRQPSLNLHIA